MEYFHGHLRGVILSPHSFSVLLVHVNYDITRECNRQISVITERLQQTVGAKAKLYVYKHFLPRPVLVNAKVAFGFCKGLPYARIRSLFSK